MAILRTEGSRLVVALSWLEKLGAMRTDVRLALSAIRSVRVSTDPWSELRGMRAPGTGIPGVISLCTRRGEGICDFAALYGKGPAVVVDAEGAAFDRLVISQDDPESVVRTIKAALVPPA